MTEKQNFDEAMKKILSVSHEEMQRRLAAAKEARDAKTHRASVYQKRVSRAAASSANHG
jgi:hypothetical protein